MKLTRAIALLIPARPLSRLGLVAGLFLLPPPAGALLNIDGSRNQVFVFGGVTFGWDSNIFAETKARGDYTISAQAGIELKRRAGIIAVNSTAKFDYVTFGKYTGENSLNPSFALELTKTTGRTTGAITINAFRETRSDGAVNLRTSSWNFPMGLSLKYPVNDHLYVTSTTGYLRRTYSNTNSVLVNYSDYSEAIDLFYVYTSKLDLIGGYRLRAATTSANENTVDHWFNIGATGGLFSKLSGTVRLGYQFRNVRHAANENYSHVNALAAISWPISRKLALGFSLSRDFNTIATGASVDSSSAAAQATYAFSRKLELSASTAVGRNRFLGVNQAGRTDTFLTWSAGASYRNNEHFAVGARYTYFHNWSSLFFSDYESHGISVDVSSRY